jgi:nicotinamide mononucleotide (NMN) deamidase PncC
MAEAMATNAREKFNSDIGIGITGVMEPTDSRDKLTGRTFIGIDDGKTRHRFTNNYPGQLYQIKQRAITSALFELRKILIYGGTHAPDY